MKKQIFSTILSAVFFMAGAQHTVTVQFTNLLPNKGSLFVGLYNSAENFPKKNRQFLQKIVAVKGSTAKVTFTNLPNGPYAVAVFQDENSNNDCDVNFMGIPKEGYGFSNNFHPRFSAPKFSDAQFLLNSDRTLSIKLIR